MPKKIVVIGTGYVGLIAAAGLADFGNTVIGVDIDKKKVDSLNNGISPIYEQGIEEYLRRNLKTGRLSFTTDIDKAIKESEVILIAVGTPSKDNGDVDLSQVEGVVKSIASAINGYKVIVTKSTVPVGTNRRIAEELKKQSGSHNFDVVSNPEFLREGKALYDFFHPDRVVGGVMSEKAKEIMIDLYRPLYLIQTPFLWCNWETAELIKYASNAFLATKITFINQMAHLSEAVGADIHKISKAMGMDGRISPKFLHPGPGYGGNCFPKDTKAVVSTGGKYGVDMSLIKETIRSNEVQKLRMAEKLKDLLGNLNGKTIAVLGLAFKNETDDIRESPALSIVGKLLEEGAKIQAHDPKAIDSFAKEYPQCEYCKDEFDAVKGAYAVVICTEWNLYRNLDLERVKGLMKGNVILDTRNLLDRDEVIALGFVYQGVGR
jgi:UDPglucose 6-dehydrogenase